MSLHTLPDFSGGSEVLGFSSISSNCLFFIGFYCLPRLAPLSSCTLPISPLVASLSAIWLDEPSLLLSIDPVAYHSHIPE